MTPLSEMAFKGFAQPQLVYYWLTAYWGLPAPLAAELDRTRSFLVARVGCAGPPHHPGHCGRERNDSF